MFTLFVGQNEEQANAFGGHEVFYGDQYYNEQNGQAYYYEGHANPEQAYFQGEQGYDGQHAGQDIHYQDENGCYYSQQSEIPLHAINNEGIPKVHTDNSGVESHLRG